MRAVYKLMPSNLNQVKQSCIEKYRADCLLLQVIAAKGTSTSYQIMGYI